MSASVDTYDAITCDARDCDSRIELGRPMLRLFAELFAARSGWRARNAKHWCSKCPVGT